MVDVKACDRKALAPEEKRVVTNDDIARLDEGGIVDVHCHRIHRETSDQVPFDIADEDRSVKIRACQLVECRSKSLFEEPGLCEPDGREEYYENGTARVN